MTPRPRRGRPASGNTELLPVRFSPAARARITRVALYREISIAEYLRQTILRQLAADEQDIPAQFRGRIIIK